MASGEVAMGGVVDEVATTLTVRFLQPSMAGGLKKGAQGWWRLDGR